MLKGIPAILSPELLKVLCEMGHSDRLVISDGNFPSESMGKDAVVIRMDGHGVPEILDAILKVFPLDTYVEKPVNLMEVMPGDPVETPIWDVYKEIVAKYAAEGKTMIGWEPMWHGYNWTDAVQSAGGSVFTDETCREVNFLTQEWIDVMTYFADNFKSGLMTMNYGGTGWEYWYANIDDVMQGRAGGYTGSAGDQGDLDFSIVGAVAQPGFGDHRSSPSTDAHLAVISKNVSQEENA